MKMDDIQCNIVNTGNNERSDLPLDDERHDSGEGAAVDGEKMEVHELAGSAVENAGGVTFEQTVEVAVGDHAN